MIIDKNIVLLTGVSCSGKTTLQKELLSRGWNRPINFTTRLPRNDGELDEYVFLTREQFDFKFNKGDFLEFTNFNGNKYGVSNTLKQNTKYIIILDAIGRSQVMEQLARKGLQPKTFYLEISEEEQLKRLNDRGSPKEEIENRMKDRLWFHPTPNCVILNGSWSIKTLADIIEQKCE